MTGSRDEEEEGENIAFYVSGVMKSPVISGENP